MNPQDFIELERTVQQKVITRAVLDEAFRRKLLTSNPKGVQELLERELEHRSSNAISSHRVLKNGYSLSTKRQSL